MEYDVSEDTVTRRVPTEEDMVKAQLLSVLAEGKRYVFLTAEIGADEDTGPYLLITSATNIDQGDVLEYVLNSAKENAYKFHDAETE